VRPSLAVWFPLALVGVLWPAPSAAADEFDAFQEARDAYDRGDHALAAERFEALVGEEPPRVVNLPLRLESRKYLGTSYLFLGKKEQALVQFERLLREDPDYLIDPLAFPEEVLASFEEVRKRLVHEQERARGIREREEQEARRREARRLLQERQQLQLLVDLARAERVEQRRSRWIALIPFGAGQFQNDHDALGIGLAVGQGLLLATHVGTYVAHQNLRGVRPADEDLQRARVTESTLRLGNQLSLGLFAVVAVVGILDAQIRFKSRVVRERIRPLPPELERLVPGGEAGAGLWTWRF
jgi:tetratricopeptide (TPR) repeat protein